MTASIPLHQVPAQLLGDLVSPRAVERTLQDAAAMRGLEIERLTPGELQDILKQDVYRRLLHNVSPLFAKKRITDVLSELARPQEGSAAPSGTHPVTALEEAARRFTLYFDWPEAQRLRGVLGIARAENEAGRPVTALVQEGQSLITQMERRLQEGLVSQAQELAELRAVFARVQGLGGREVRRLDSLLGQLDQAQSEGTLLLAELERARSLSFKLRRSLESSVVSPGDPLAAGAAEAQARVQALEQEHAAQQLAVLAREFAPLLRLRPDLEAQAEALRQTPEGLSEQAVEHWRAQLIQTRDETVEAQRAELTQLERQLAGFATSPEFGRGRVALDVARLTLQSGNLATDELRELRDLTEALRHAPEVAARILGAQRELADLERTARDVVGAAEALAGPLNAARQAIASGHPHDLAPLWTALERQMGRAAQQRQDFDARADHVIAEYDEVRSLAGETIQRLGRLAEALRAQRRLGPMSPEARERYVQTLEEAEALLGEARAEFQAAQEVTATFGEGALNDLLDVFDFGSELSALGEGAGATLSPAPVPNPAATDGREALAGSGAVGSALPLPAAELWHLQAGQVVMSTADRDVGDFLRLLAQAETLRLTRLDMADETHVWSARRTGDGGWRLARADNWSRLDEDAGPWLDTGERPE